MLGVITCIGFYSFRSYFSDQVNNFLSDFTLQLDILGNLLFDMLQISFSTILGNLSNDIFIYFGMTPSTSTQFNPLIYNNFFSSSYYGQVYPNEDSEFYIKDDPNQSEDLLPIYFDSSQEYDEMQLFVSTFSLNQYLYAYMKQHDFSFDLDMINITTD